MLFQFSSRLLTDRLGAVLKSARKALGLTQQELATRAGVSVRLWAEVERGVRPNVSLATALSMLREAGLTVSLEDVAGSTHQLLDAQSESTARRARAELRRATWSGQQSHITEPDMPAKRQARKVNLPGAVTEVSEQANSMSRAALRARVFQLGAEPGDDLSSNTTVDQRLEMVDVLSRRMWELSGRPVPVYSRSEMPVVRVRRT